MLNISKFCGSAISCAHKKEYFDGDNEWVRVSTQNQLALELQKYYKGRYIPGFHIHPDYVEESIKEIDKISEVLKRDFDEDCSIDMPSGTIEKIIGRKLTWDDEPVEI